MTGSPRSRVPFPIGRHRAKASPGKGPGNVHVLRDDGTQVPSKKMFECVRDAESNVTLTGRPEKDLSLATRPGNIGPDVVLRISWTLTVLKKVGCRRLGVRAV